jgi:hypothetical protein
MSGRKSIHPLTEESIELQGPSLVGMVSQSGCACELRDGWEATTGKWWLCSYHDGFEDGIAAMAEHQPKVNVTVTLAGELTSRLVCPRCDEPWPCAAITPEPRPMPDLHPTPGDDR